MSGEQKELIPALIKLISETNGVSLGNTLELATHSMLFKEIPSSRDQIIEFHNCLYDHQRGLNSMEKLLEHPVALALETIFKSFPLPFQEEHIHLTGSLSADFVYPRLKKLLEGPNKDAYTQKIKDVYGESAFPLDSVEKVDSLIRPQSDITFERYLQLLTLPKLVLTSQEAHEEATYHMAQNLNQRFNIGRIRLKFSLSRATSNAKDSLPGQQVSPEQVVLGLYNGFEKYRKENPGFDFILSPSFRKESFFFDRKKFNTKKEDFSHQIQTLLGLLDKYPFLESKVTDVDTVGAETDHYRKAHFEEMRVGFRKLQFRGFEIRSHHGETWRTLRKGVQAVDNAMNIWHIDALEHGVSLGVNPNYYFHMIFEKVMEKNYSSQAVDANSPEGREILEMDWNKHPYIPDKLINGKKLNEEEVKRFIKTKFHTAREIEHYQHDVLNRMINKGVGLVALPSSNIKLTGNFPRYKDHPFSWWEKKGVDLGVGTDNYITLNTNFIREMLILLITDMDQLKITKLLMVVTGENRRPVISRMLWNMRFLDEDSF